MSVFICDITFMAHTDRIEVKKLLVSDELSLHDNVTSIHNGLSFRIETKKHLYFYNELNKMYLPEFGGVKIIKEVQ